MRRALLVLPLLLAGCAGPLFSTPAATPGEPSPTVTMAVISDPALPMASSSPTLTPIENLGLTGTAIDVDIESYRLVVDGKVERPLSLSYGDLMAYPSVSQVLRLDCPGFFVDYAEWAGPLVRVILEQAAVLPDAATVTFYDGAEFPYEKTLTLEEALRDDTILAYRVNGEILPKAHGFPLRLAAGSELGSFWVKWLFRIEVG